MEITQNSIDLRSFVRPVVNIFLMLITLVLGVATLFAVLDILVMITGYITIQSTEMALKQVYFVAVIRYVWLLIGACTLLAYVILCVDYFPQRLRRPRTSKFLQRVLLAELLFIALSVII